MKMWHLMVYPVVHISISGTCCHHFQDRIWTKLGQDKKGDQVRERTGGLACLETEMGRSWDPRRVWGWKGLEWINVVSHWSTELLSVSVCEIIYVLLKMGLWISCHQETKFLISWNFQKILNPVYADELLQDCVINMSDVATNCVPFVFFTVYFCTLYIFTIYICKLFNPHLMGEMPDLYIRNLLIKWCQWLVKNWIWSYMCMYIVTWTWNTV
jgi:hypothetical protein